MPQVLVEYHGGGYLHIAVTLVYLAPVVEQGVAQHHALGEEEGEAGALLHEGEQAELLAQLAVVALLGLLDAVDVLLKVGLLNGLSIHLFLGYLKELLQNEPSEKLAKSYRDDFMATLVKIMDSFRLK